MLCHIVKKVLTVSMKDYYVKRDTSQKSALQGGYCRNSHQACSRTLCISHPIFYSESYSTLLAIHTRRFGRISQNSGRC